MGAKLLFESGDVGKALNLSAVRIRQLAAAGVLPVAFRTPRGGYLFVPDTIHTFARRQRGKSAVEGVGVAR